MRYPCRAGWSWNDDNRGLDARPDKVKLSLDKTGYRAGDKLKVTLTPPHAGKGVLLVESDKLLYVLDIDVKAGGSSFEIPVRSEEHTSELQSLMRLSYAVLCLHKKTQQIYLLQIYNIQIHRYIQII